MRWTLKAHDETFKVELVRQNRTEFTFSVNGREVTLERARVGSFSIEARDCRLAIERWSQDEWRCSDNLRTYRIEPLRLESQKSDQENRLKTQIPGRILKVLVKEGDLIEANQPLLIIEAMKMENEIRANGKGRVAKILVQPNQSVESGALLLELASEKYHA